MLIGLKQNERERAWGELGGSARPSSGNSGWPGQKQQGFPAEIPFPGSSQGRFWSLWGLCGLCPPAPSLPAASFHAGSLGMTLATGPGMEAAGGGQGSFLHPGRASQLSERLSLAK